MAERGAWLLGGLLAPLVTCLLLLPADSLSDFGGGLLRSLPWAMVGGAISGAVAGWLLAMKAPADVFHNFNAEDSAAEIKRLAAELVTGKQDDKLLEQANRQSDNQEGSAASVYIDLRLQQIRKDRAANQGQSGHSVRLIKRVLWGLSLPIGSIALSAILGFISAGQLPIWFAGLAVLLLPLLVTAFLITVAAAPNADRWLGALQPDFSSLEREPKIRKPTGRSVEGGWHKKNRGQNVPVLRGLLLIVLVGAAGLFALRQYQPFGSGEQASPDAAASNTSDETATSPDDVAKPVPQSSPPRPAATPARTAAPPPPRPTPRPTKRPTVWDQVPINGSLVRAAPADLAAASRSIDDIRAALSTTEPRLRSWYRETLRNRPNLHGRIRFGLIVHPDGYLSAIDIRSSQFLARDEFVLGLIDRLDITQFGAGATAPVTLDYRLDFRP